MCTITHTHTHTHTHSLTHSRTQTHTHSHTHTYTLTHTHLCEWCVGLGLGVVEVFLPHSWYFPPHEVSFHLKHIPSLCLSAPRFTDAKLKLIYIKRKEKGNLGLGNLVLLLLFFHLGRTFLAESTSQASCCSRCGFSQDAGSLAAGGSLASPGLPPTGRPAGQTLRVSVRQFMCLKV